MQVGKAFGKWSNVFEIRSTSMKGRWDGLKMLISFYQINACKSDSAMQQFSKIRVLVQKFSVDICRQIRQNENTG